MTLNPAANWLYNQIALFGPGVALTLFLLFWWLALCVLVRFVDRLRIRRAIRRLELQLRNPNVRARYSRKEKP
jgi:hypothetical protein